MPQHLDKILLDQDDRRELVVRVHFELHVVPPCEAVVATVRASAIGVQGPVERHALDPVEGRSTDDLLVSRLVGATLGLRQGGSPASFDAVRDLPRRRPSWPEIKEEWMRCRHSLYVRHGSSSHADQLSSRAIPTRYTPLPMSKPWVLVLLAAGGAAALIIYARTADAAFAPAGDIAVIERYTLHATHGELLLGPYAR